jgi:2-methylcitrate dehydratase PrpD
MGASTTGGARTAMDEIIANVLEAQFEAIDLDTLQNAKDRIIDTVGCLIGGAGDPSNPELVRLIKDYGGKPEATILMYGGKVPAANAAMVNCVLCRSFDYEPVSPVVEGSMAPGHVSGTTVMTALTLSEAVGAGGRELITAMLLGDDLAARLLNTCEFTLALGWDGNGTANALGATAIAGRLLGLNEKQLRNAFGLVLSQLGGSAQNISESTTAFKLPLGLAARNAIFSAELAAAGWTAPKDALQGRFGYYDLFTSGIRDEELLTKDLGKKFWGDRTFKPYPSCRGTHGPIDCALDIVNNHGVDPDSIEEVTVHLPPGALNGVLTKPWEIGDFPHGDAIFSFRFTVATALLKGSVRPEHFTEEAIRDPKTNEFIKKIGFADLPPQKTGFALTVRTKDGGEYAGESAIARGDIPGNPLSRDELVAKFWGNVEFAHKHKKSDAEKLLELLEDLEGRDSISEVTRLLVP